ncbi:hypothetical protein OG558_12705 [Kribbella sp. NBC_01510]|uniref:hypothetical protein n=1 Tax=Kribbella sp. NBC_01510 TaxID=2903581 RepID=UPI00386A1D98
MSPTEPEPPAKPSQPNQPSSSIRLGWIARVTCGLVGAAAGVLGVIGVFTKDASSIGVPVLLALSAFFGYIAVSGQRLNRLKMGEYEAAFDQLAHVVTYNVLENQSVPTEVKGDVAAALGEVRAELPTSTRRALSDALFAAQNQSMYERALRMELRRLFPDDYAGLYVSHDGIDAVRLRGQTEKQNLAVSMKFVSHAELHSRDLKGFLTEFGPPIRLLLVSNAPLSGLAEAHMATLMRELDYASFVQWRSPADNEALVKEINRRLERRNPA